MKGIKTALLTILSLSSLCFGVEENRDARAIEHGSAPANPPNLPDSQVHQNYPPYKGHNPSRRMPYHRSTPGENLHKPNAPLINPPD